MSKGVKIMKLCVLTVVMGMLYLVSAQSGGPYDLSLNTMAGGGTSSAGPVMIDSTVGQPAAGVISNNGATSVRGGFWAFHSLVPTAAGVAVGGRVQTATGRGIVGAHVTIFSAAGQSGTAITSSFGFYRFENVTSGSVYLVSVSSKQHTFEEPTRTILVVDELTDIDFVAVER